MKIIISKLVLKSKTRRYLYFSFLVRFLMEKNSVFGLPKGHKHSCLPSVHLHFCSQFFSIFFSEVFNRNRNLETQKNSYSQNNLVCLKMCPEVTCVFVKFCHYFLLEVSSRKTLQY